MNHEIPASTSSPGDGLLDRMGQMFDHAIVTDQDHLVDIVEARKYFEKMLELLRNELGAHAAHVVFLDPTGQYETIFSVGADPGFVKEWWSRVSTNKGIVGKAVETGRSIWTLDVTKEPAFVRTASGKTVAQLTLLLREGPKANAVVAIEWGRPIDDIEALVGPIDRFAMRLGVQITSFRARVFALRSQRAFEAAQRISEMETSEGRIQGIFDAVEKLTGGGEVALLRRTGSQLIVVSKRELKADPPPIDIRVEKTNGYVAEVAFARKPFYCDDTSDALRFPFYRRVDESTRCQFSVPLIFRRELVGVLNVGSRQPYAFGHMTRGLLIQFAAHAAAVLYNTAVLDGILSIYDDVRRHLAYLSMVAPSDTHPGTQRLTLDAAVTRIRHQIENIWLGLSPAKSQSGYGDREASVSLRQLRESVREALLAAFPDALHFSGGDDDRSDALIPRKVATTFLSALNALAEAKSDTPPSLRGSFDVESIHYDRGRTHAEAGARLIGVDEASVSYLVVRTTLTAALRYFEDIPAGNLVTPMLTSADNPLVPVHDLGVTLWAADRVLAARGGFVEAKKSADGTVHIAFWLMTDEKSGPNVTKD
ncbi:MAG TPA: GAF domain-containing protein [Thermoanaerobaculia bacterium]|jgi:putative methionine-R-sulfoxide reductase with GAF domain